jgi:hypothetical protein
VNFKGEGFLRERRKPQSGLNNDGRLRWSSQGGTEFNRANERMGSGWNGAK